MRSNVVSTNYLFEICKNEVSGWQQKEPRTSVDRAVNYIIENFGEDVVLEDLANAAGITKFNLCRAFQRRYAVSPMKWLWIFRALLAAEFINLAPSWSITDIAFTCGFTSSAHFSRSFHALHGMSPSEYRNHAKSKRQGDGAKVYALSDYGVIYEDNKVVVEAAFSRMLAHLQSSSLPVKAMVNC